MLKISIKNRAGENVFSIDEKAIIGRDAACDIRIADQSASRKNAEIFASDGSYFVKDLKSTNGTYLNGQRLEAEKVYSLKQGDIIKIGKENIAVLGGEETGPKEEVKDEALRMLKEEMHQRLLRRMDLRHASMDEMEGVREKAKSALEEIIKEMDTSLPEGIDRSSLIREILDEALGLGPLEALMKDPSITEVMVNGLEGIYVEVNGKLRRTLKRFSTEKAILRAIERIVSPLGRRIDESSPMVDARLKDGSRVNAVIPPLSLIGPVITIRKFSNKPFTINDLIMRGTMSANMAEFLRIAVENRMNIIISGGTGSGKTTLLNVLASFIPQGERIVTIEDAAELRLPQEHVVSLEARPPNIEGKGAVTIRDLVRNALRMRPDRIVVGECRGGEALDMLQAMNTGHDGSLTTAHANSPRDLLSRVETMVLMSGMELPVRAIRDQIRGAIDLIVHQARIADGTRKVTHIAEVQGMEGDVITLQDVFTFNQKGYSPEGKVTGEFRPTGFVPQCIEEMRTRGVKVPQEIFS